MARPLIAIVAVAAFATAPGCLTLYSKTEVVRSNVSRRPISFAGPEAATEFYAALDKCEDTIGETYLGVPFVTLYAKRQQLSEAAAWNDAVGRCDTNQDGIITLDEAKIFAASVNH